MIVRNNTHYPTLGTRFYNEIPDPLSFVSQSNRRQSYYQRIYFEHQYTKKIGGQTFFYTFTYNNKALPYYTVPGTDKKYPSFCYDDIRLITNGSFSKYLERHFGSRLVYFCAPESGEGKGSRGYGNNPHYHFLFFIQPIHVDGKPVYDKYKRITPVELNKHLRRIWLGSDARYVYYPTAKFGIVEPGENLGLVDDTARCFGYVGKYVTKDFRTLAEYRSIVNALYDSCKDNGIDTHVIYNYYRFLSDLHDGYTKYDFIHDLGLDLYQVIRKSNPISLSWFYSHPEFYNLSPEVRSNYSGLLDYFNKYYCHYFVEDQLRVYRNRYSGKPRMSKSLGLYGINFIHEDNDSVYLKMPAFEGYKVQRPSMYYLRKLYYDVFKCPITGNVLYRLNQRGLDRSVQLLPTLIQRHISNTLSNIATLCRNQYVFLTDEPQFDFNGNPIDYKFSETSVCKRVYSLPKDDSLYYKYAVYSLVYKNRFYSPSSSIRLTSAFHVDCIKEDFRFFSDNYIDFADFYQFNSAYFRRAGFIQFSSHPLFKDLMYYFDLFDIINDRIALISSDYKSFAFDANLWRHKRLLSINF